MDSNKQAEFRIYLREHGYLLPHEKNGVWVAVYPFLFTTGIVTHLTKDGYSTRYCYEHFEDACRSLIEWNGEGDPPGPWIKRKGIGGDYLNPNFCKDEGNPND